MDKTRVNQEIDEDEKRHRQHSLVEAKTEFEIFDKEMNLFSELLLFKEKLPPPTILEDLKISRAAQGLLIVDIFNCVRSTYKLLLAGYYGQLAPLLRRVNECALRILFFQAFPEKAKLFLNKPKEWREIYRKEELIRRELELEKDAHLTKLTNTLHREYRELSELTHANFGAMITHMYPIPQKGKVYFSVGGNFHPTWLHIYGRVLITWAMLGLKVSAIPYYDALEKLQPEWLRRAIELDETIGKLEKPKVEF